VTALLLAAAIAAAPEPFEQLDRATRAIERLACYDAAAARLEAAVVARAEARPGTRAHRAAGRRWRAAYRALTDCRRSSR
jgi:hypothetical protein